jgi:hypothetical protein
LLFGFVGFPTVPPRFTHAGLGVPERSHFRPFTGVLQEIRREVTQNVWETPFAATPWQGERRSPNSNRL